MLGFLPVDKPGGWTSHDVVAKVRTAARIKKVGHAGTLDPMATGLLVVAIGPVTRLIRFAQDAEKEYLATAVLGIATDSLDADGDEVAREPMSVDRAALERVLPGFMGQIQQVPPMVSALKVDGKRLYELAREGKEIERAARTVVVHQLELLDIRPGEFPEMDLRIVCSKGTYIRSLADDIAVALGGRAHLTALRRTRIGPIVVDHAVRPDGLTSDVIAQHIQDPLSGVPTLPRLIIEEDEAALVRNGRSLPRDGRLPIWEQHAARRPCEDLEVAVVDEDLRLLAVYRCGPDEFTPEIVLPS
ncbi:MAG: tRNA pseudouridine(55) synthase TruB [Acidimicrobiia bacterium]|nr:tRNA pseudouridine(55) synthase TruB [Acidimicrobiia bacterium]